MNRKWRTTVRWWVGFAVGVFGGVLLQAAGEEQASPAALRLPPLAKAPVIDGTLAPGEWDGAFQGCGVLRHAAPRGVLEVRKARYWLGYDKERVYFAFQTELPPWGKLDGKRRRIVSEAGSDDEIEIFINPGRPAGSLEESYYQLMGNWAGTLCNFTHNPKVTGSMPFSAAVQFENSVRDGWWTAELAVRADDLHHAVLADGQTWGFNLCRYWHHPSTYSGWPSGMDYFGRAKYLQVTLDQGAPVVRVLGLGDPQGGKPGVDLELFNPGAKEQTLAVNLRVADRTAGKEVKDARKVTLAAGQRQTVKWATAWEVSAKDNVLELDVTSTDGAVRYFRTALPFDRDNARKDAWEAPPADQTAANDLKLAFYPGTSRLRCLLNFSGLRFASMVTRAEVRVQNAAGQEVGQAAAERFSEGEGEVIVALPKPLPEGTYAAELRLLSGSKPVTPPIKHSFVRKAFPFENNTIGVSDKVLFPWTPMQTDPAKGTVACWNREVTLARSGLFEQVRSGTTELLARPMQWVAKKGGAELAWEESGVRFANSAPHAVDFAAAATAPGVKVETVCHSEYDGMFQYTVTLTPQGDGQLDGLDLVVPLKEQFAWLLHATSDGCRSNSSIFTPRGEGRVWDSLQVRQWRLSASFIPYLWLGDDRAGLCWWADSEKGWVRPADKGSPAIEVRRAPGEVQMVFHVIGRPFRLTEPRTFVFAFNATPVRPRPQWARGWTNVSGKAEGFRKGPHISVYGSCSWVSLGKDSLPDRPYTYASLRPFSDEAEAWLKDRMQKEHAAGTSVVVYTDIISRAVDRGDELRHYASEWDRYNNCHPQEVTAKWPSNAQIAANLTRSRIDYDLWCMQQDAELGIDGFYFDEIQTVGQLNPAADLGFVDETGNWESETSLFAMRTYFKRLYTLLQKRGAPEPFIMPHSSSTMYAGPLAFTTIPMDLEMASSDPDPNRGQVFGLGEPYALCNVMAFQHGFAGSGMVCPAPNAAYGAGDWRMGRTFLGSMLLFDCHPIFGVPAYEGRLMDSILGAFGYDDPGVEYVPYWRAVDLQEVGPERVHVSLFRNPGRKSALLVLYNDSPAGVTAKWNPTPKFGCTDTRLTLPNFTGIKGETFYSYSRDVSGAFLLHIPPYDYRLATVACNGTWGAPESWGPVDPALLERNVKTVKP